jgi:uncharacterized protein (TIRG00374 family)
MTDLTSQKSKDKNYILNIIMIILKLLLVLVVFWMIALQIDWPNFKAIVSRLSLGFALLGIMLITIQNLLAGARWWFIMEKLSSFHLTFPLTLKFLYISVLLNQVLPSSVGGDATRVLLAHNYRVPIGYAVRSVLLDRILTILGLLLLITFSLPFIEQAIPAAPGQLLFTLTLLLLTGGCLFLYVVSLISPQLERLHVLRRPTSFVLSLKSFLLSPKKVIPPTLSAMLGFSMMTLIVYAMSVGLSINLSFIQCALLCPPIFLLAALPISIAGWGVREAGMVVGLGYAGVSPEEALALSLMLGTTVLIGSMPGLLYIGDLFGNRFLPKEDSRQ